MVFTQRGFTLIEISIVLIIIGLLLGGVLKGQEMINDAKIRNIEQDMAGIAAAIHTYQDRYKALPGDDKRAAGRWAAASDGDGDGLLEGTLTALPRPMKAASCGVIYAMRGCCRATRLSPASPDMPPGAVRRAGQEWGPAVVRSAPDEEICRNHRCASG